jgi:hypothetical protein
MQHPLLHQLCLQAEAKHSGGHLVDSEGSCLLAEELVAGLEHTHLAENVLEGWWLLGHGFSLVGTILGALVVCRGWNLEMFF